MEVICMLRLAFLGMPLIDSASIIQPSIRYNGGGTRNVLLMDNHLFFQPVFAVLEF